MDSNCRSWPSFRALCLVTMSAQNGTISLVQMIDTFLRPLNLEHRFVRPQLYFTCKRQLSPGTLAYDRIRFIRRRSDLAILEDVGFTFLFHHGSFRLFIFNT